ncbi:LLM class F420-dependent oxidoreductase [Actinoalloteichus hymeniacidonis]|uniref:F420-dependent oxidoreductase n=1 Tax=Actinoalloteichus hymeniacidonis TaxID=340345 RepID=A0AAC9HT83_9PSEU|nr:LLM class F420-dependent oxidoreductase [Actinoalloteichus hymeniacidonis]AOS65164.1 putative F420-dependent oxidoreductase [Actinoalloteichus hymeniacidonis]MBB5906757.1 alkanesulfonate monooxygenase [Actinoalloteichus hymeniacidonis]
MTDSLAFRVFTEPQQGASYDDLLRLARHAEHLDYDAFYRSDHYLVMGDDNSGLPGPTDAWITLAGLARETARIRLGTMVSAATFYLPGPLAIAVAQVDQMSGGRVDFGLGTGWYAEEHTAYGIPFPPLGERFDRFEEQLAIITGLWATEEGAKFSYDGRHYRLVDSPALPKPTQRPGPPVLIGGSGAKRTPRLAAQYADEFNLPFADIEQLAAQFDRVKAAAEARDRDPASLRWSTSLVLCAGETEAEITRRAAAIKREPAELRKNGLGGTPAEIVDKLGRYRERTGIDRIYLQVLDVTDLEHLDLIAEQVRPQLG